VSVAVSFDAGTTLTVTVARVLQRCAFAKVHTVDFAADSSHLFGALGFLLKGQAAFVRMYLECLILEYSSRL
jgi:hypothetical protein